MALSLRVRALTSEMGESGHSANVRTST
jgi:hypothetical protein